MDRQHGINVCLNCGGRPDVGHQVRSVIVTRLGEMHLVPLPAPGALIAIPRLRIVGGIEALGRESQFAAFPEPHSVTLPLKVPHPARSQRHDGGHVSKSSVHVVLIEGIKQAIPVLPGLHDKSSTLGLSSGEAKLLGTLAVPRRPSGRRLVAEPFWGHRRQAVQGRTQGLDQQFIAGQDPHTAQDMRRVRALLPPDL